MLIVSTIKSFQYVLMPDEQVDVLNMRGVKAERIINRPRCWNDPDVAAERLAAGQDPLGGHKLWQPPSRLIEGKVQST